METSETSNNNIAPEATVENSTKAAQSEVGVLGNSSVYGSNPDLPGFTSDNLEEHWESHKKEYHGWTKKQYAQRAHDLVRSATNENILGYKAKNGSIARFDKSTGDFVQGFDTGIATMFKLKGGEVRFNKKKQRAEVDL